MFSQASSQLELGATNAFEPRLLVEEAALLRELPFTRFLGTTRSFEHALLLGRHFCGHRRLAAFLRGAALSLDLVAFVREKVVEGEQKRRFTEVGHESTPRDGTRRAIETDGLPRLLAKTARRHVSIV